MIIPLQFIGTNASRKNMRALNGLQGVNEDAEALLVQQGFKAADCKFVPYGGPFGGGTNVCDIGDGNGYQYGSELLLQPGGVAIARVDSARQDASIAEAQAEDRKIQAMIASGEYARMAEENRKRLCEREPWTCVGTPTATATLKVNPAVQSTPPAASSIVVPNALQNPAPSVSNGSGSAAQRQTPTTDPKTVQGSQDKPQDSQEDGFDYLNDGIEVFGIDVPFFMIVAGAVGLWYLTKGGR